MAIGLSYAEAIRAPNKWVEHAHNQLVSGEGPLVDMRARVVEVGRHRGQAQMFRKSMLGEVGGVWHRYKKQYVEEEPKTKSLVEWKLHSKQAEIWSTIFQICSDQVIPLQEVIAIGGRRSGKTEAAVFTACSLALIWPGTNGQVWGYSFTDNLEAVGSTISKFYDALPDNWVLDYEKKQKTLHLVNGSTIRFMSANKPRSARSGAPHWAVLDEPSHYDNPEAVLTALLPALAENSAPCFMITSPLGYDAIYEEVLKAQDPEPLVSQAVKVVQFGSPYDNPFLPDSTYRYLKSLELKMSPAQRDQEIYGKHVNTSGLVLYDYSEKRHLQRWSEVEPWEDITEGMCQELFAQEGKEWILGMDFNENPISCIAAKMRVDGIFHIVHEWQQDKANTYRFATGQLQRWLKLEYPDLSEEERAQKVLIIGDASGQWQEFGKYKGGVKEIPAFDQLRAAGFTVIPPQRRKRRKAKRRKKAQTYSRNPFRGARMESARARFMGVDGIARVKVDPDCKNVNKMCQTIPLYYSLPDLKHKLIHIFDAVTYPIFRIFPYLDVGAAPGADQRENIYVYELVENLSKTAKAENGQLKTL